MTAAPGPQQPDEEAAAVARAEERTAQVWDPCENDDNYDDARMELFLAFSAEERRAVLARSVVDDLDITPETATEARLLDIARELAGLPECEQPPAQEPSNAARPAASSAQPDEVCVCGHERSQHDARRRLPVWDPACLPPGSEHCRCPGFRPAAPSAQPNRDTGGQG